MERENLDVLIIGAGISGIGQGCHLVQKRPGTSFAIIEARKRLGGTWDLFRYPGIRSDSDMFTFGYRFRPWKSPKDIAPGPDILAYLDETVDEYGLRDRIRLQTRVTSLNWSSAEKRWIAVLQPDEGEAYEIAARFVVSCTGYYNYDHGHLPEFEGYDDFNGVIAHPQHWPEDLDYAGKRVIVIGSGATAVTIVPTMAETAAHVTMLQRSPSYVFSRPGVDKFADILRRVLPWRWAYKLSRIKNVLLSIYLYNVSQRKPDKIRAYLRKLAVDELGEDFDVDTHFNPSYGPWDQRLCLIPDGDLYKALKSDRADIVTDHVDRFTQTGLRTKSGRDIDADIIVPATGLQIQFGGGMEVSLDGQALNPAEHLVYRGMMVSNVPNLAVTFGYTNASWTLKADLTADYVCRLLTQMDKRGVEVVTPKLDAMPDKTQPLVGLQSGYLLRAEHMLPKSGLDSPWKNHENYISDMMSIRYGKFDDGVLAFGG
ncbi:MAG: flavin-containing monooxygenase [Arenibacterium sp.]